MYETKGMEIDQLKIKIYPTRQELGHAAALTVTSRIVELQRSGQELRMIFAAAPSQNEFLENLIKQKDIDWSKITAFHMDEYIGLTREAPQGFGNYLKRHLFDHVPFKQVHYIDPEPDEVEAECRRYASLINEAPIDIICMGIGENGHIAFNDPPVADFRDPVSVKTVVLDEQCRQQQVNDGCFNSITNVPKKAVTVTIPLFMSAGELVIVVPGPTKASAVYRSLTGPVQETCPASILRKHEHATLFLDQDSAIKLNN